MKRNRFIQHSLLLAAAAALVGAAVDTHAADKKPNVVCIMGDDIGIWNIGAYSRGMMAGRTPNLDKLAKGGMLFTDYYAEASCTAGRANFIMGQLPIRTGMTTVGQAGSPIGIPAAAPTIATVLKSMGKDELKRFDLTKAKLNATLVKVYDRDKSQFGVVEFQFDLPLAVGAEAGKGFKILGGKLVIQGTFDGSIDGSVFARNTRATMMYDIRGWQEENLMPVLMTLMASGTLEQSWEDTTKK